MNIFPSEFLGWNLISSGLLIGIYYGILTTLPLAPSQLLSIRVLLLEDENKQGKMTGAGSAKGIFIAGVSGFLVAQLAIFMSIYYPLLYVFWFKPHLCNILLPLFLLWHYFKIIEFDPVTHLIPNYKHPLLDPRLRIAFIESFLLQIINPIVLPNPVFPRLMSIFLFRYSHIPIFVLGGLIGWLSGQLLFIILSWILLSRLESDSPSIYRIVKRIIHWVFPPIIIGILLSYMGRVSMIPFYKKTYKEKYTLPYYLWPDICFKRDSISSSTHFMLSPHQSKLRNQANAPFNTLNIPLHKNHFSQYFFALCISDGKQRLLHNYPISISLIQNDLKKIVNISKDTNFLEKEWIEQKEYRLSYLNKILSLKLNNLEEKNNFFLEKRINSISQNNLKLHNLSQLIRKKNNNVNELSQSIRKYISSNFVLNKRIRKSYDTRLGNSLRKQPRIMKDDSFWFINQNEDMQTSPINNRNYITRWNLTSNRLKRLKKIISKLRIYDMYYYIYKKIPIWKSRTKSSSFYYEFEFFKKNLTRRRRRKFFVRSFVVGSTFGRSRNIIGIFFQFFKNKPHSSFFLRAKEIEINPINEVNQKERISQTESEKFDFSSSHSIRGPALIIQAFLRKYIKLPFLILLKNSIRLVLMHSVEWNQDWSEWAKEKYVYCYYNGNHVPNDQMPPHWLGDGLQIKILMPFHLKPWSPSSREKKLDLEPVTLMKSKSSYINIWGQETDVPFGQVYQILFFKPIVKGVVLFFRFHLARILRSITMFFKKKYLLYSRIFGKKIDIVDTNNHIEKVKKNIVHQIIEKEKSNYINESIVFKENILDFDKSLHLDEKLDFNTTFKNNKIHAIAHHIPINFLKDENLHLANEKTDLYNLFIQKNYYISFSKKLHEKCSIFPSHLIFKEISQYLIYKKLKITLIYIELYQQWIFYKKFILKLILNLIRLIKTKKIQEKRNIVKVSLYIKSVISKYFVLLKRYLVNKFEDFIYIKNKNVYSQFKLRDYLNVENNHDYLSHAYILHKIWQTNFINRLSLLKINTDWKDDILLNEHIEIFGKNYGFFQNTPEDLTVDQFREWLKLIRYYTPSPEIWDKISPNKWRNLVNEFWSKNDSFIHSYKYDKKSKFDQRINYLSFYKLLFAKNKKMLKRWEIDLLMNNYTEYLRDHNVTNVQAGWHTQSRQQNQITGFNLIKNNLFKNSFISKSSLLTWGLSNTRTNGLALSSSLIKSFPGSNVSKKKTFTLNKQPIYQKYKKIGLGDHAIINFKKRVSFRPIVQYRWKSEKERFEVLNTIDLIRKAKLDLKNAIKNAMLAKKHKSKSTSIFVNKIQESTLQWEALNLSPFTFQSIKKRQAKIIDDEILMHKIITSFLKFKQIYSLSKDFSLLNSTKIFTFLTNKSLSNKSFVITEDLFLRNTLREYRILSCFDFFKKNELNKYHEIPSLNKRNIDFIDNIDKSYYQTTQTSYQEVSHSIIQSYLWPTFRLEDIACINRFWINTANQSRFTSFRIRIYPNITT